MRKTPILFFCLLVVLTASVARAQSNDSLSSDPPKEDNPAMDLFKEGTAAYLRQDYKDAIPLYEKALDLEKKKRRLERKLWIVLVDNLSIAYGITGDIRSSHDVIEYGISVEPTYPLFYYNNACGYAEESDEDNAIKNLRLAYKYRKNVLEGESLPDPATDNSFERLMKSTKFRKALTEMQSGN